jgi:translation initiation factor IF-1
LPFGPADVKLETGDVVYIESRDAEYYAHGGLLPAGLTPLPRDHDLDVLDAIALAGGNAAGPAGGGLNQSFRGGPGNIVSPSRIFVVRKLSDRQVTILVNRKRALNDATQRIAIQPGDLVLLKYTPLQLATNVAINLVSFGFAIPNGR